MRKSRLSAYKQHKVIEHFVVGTTARCASKFVNVNKNTAILCFQRLWEIIAHHREQGSLEVFDGEIDVDERYFGGTQKGKRGAAGKVPVFGLLRRGGKVYTQTCWMQNQQHQCSL